MHQGICKTCGGTFWESFRGARGEDLCDACETLRYARSVFAEGQPVLVDRRPGVVRRIDGHGVHVEFSDCPEIGTWAHDPDDVQLAS